MGWLKDLKRRHDVGRHPFPEQAWREAISRLPILAGLDDAQQRRLGERAWRLLHRLRLTLPPGLDWGWRERLGIAAQVSLMTLEWREDDAVSAFTNVHEIVIVPDAFRRRVEEMDETGVVHEFDDERVGETSYQGPVVLSLTDIEHSGNWAGFNVIIHEFSHKLDMGNSMDVDGFPPLPRDMSAKEWHRIYTAVWDDLQAHLERGEPTPIDGYAATHPGECFAVTCEYFFSAPDELAAAYPELYALLGRYFRQDPLARL
ncbi:M90 family metallopeptidase [Phytohalomonas tamaricis]|uniref:M90 family metallopeptidase n=1 Tax=Phytohalomonas tamaricis TaxID=2081032 RepID=UPI000D0B4499|nr:M90 family metallopeptidase [Phytohalomonas tamaricis]